MKSTSFLAALVGAAYFVSAQQTTGPVSITQPLQGTTWGIGSTENVTWQNVQDGVSSLLINLMKGDPNALTLVQALATNVDPQSGSTQVQIPQNATEGNDYSLAVGTDPSQMAYIGGIVLSNSGGSNSSTDGTATTQSNTQSPGNSTLSSLGQDEKDGKDDKKHGKEKNCIPLPPPSGSASASSGASSGVPSSCIPPSGGPPSGASVSGASVASASATGAPTGSPTVAAGGFRKRQAASAASGAASGAASITSAVGSAAASATDMMGASGSDASPSASSSTSGSTRNLVSGVLMAVPAALVAMTGF
jgi:hypothetical protein